MNKMTFHESYGSLPLKTLRLIRKYNVSPADFDQMTDLLGLSAWVTMSAEETCTVCGQPDNCGDCDHTPGADWSEIDNHIVSNSDTGMYRPQFF